MAVTVFRSSSSFGQFRKTAQKINIQIRQTSASYIKVETLRMTEANQSNLRKVKLKVFLQRNGHSTERRYRNSTGVAH